MADPTPGVGVLGSVDTPQEQSTASTESSNTNLGPHTTIPGIGISPSDASGNQERVNDNTSGSAPSVFSTGLSVSSR
jgi:hypothetical protein